MPTVCVVFGATTGDAAYLPALSDYTIMVRGHAKMLTIHPQPARPRAVKTDPASQALKSAHPLLTPIREASPAQPMR